MNVQQVLSELNAWFEKYIGQFSSDDPMVQENIHLKTVHTRRVCEAILDIGKSLGLSDEDLCIAEISALLHDIGRFKQYKQYGTFSDYKSEDHASLGVTVIRTNGALQAFDPGTIDIIVKTVGYHNRATLPVGEDERCLFFLKLLRDADKVDIWRVVTEYYQEADKMRNPAIELDLPDTHSISDSVYMDLVNGRLAQMADLKTLSDFKLLQIGWIYDVNFPRTFQIVRDNEYLKKIYNSLTGNSTQVSEIYERAIAYLKCKM